MAPRGKRLRVLLDERGLDEWDGTSDSEDGCGVALARVPSC